MGERRTKRGARIWFYGAVSLVVGGLLYGGFLHQPQPGLSTLLGATNMQLRLAHGMPATDKQGQPLPARSMLLDKAEAQLALAHDQAPESPVVAEFQGFLQQLRGDWRGAAGSYRRARTLPGCAADQHDTLVFNEARALAMAGDPEAALAVFTHSRESLQEQFVLQRDLEEAGLLGQLGRDVEAMQRLQRVAAGDTPMAWVQAAHCYEEMGRVDEAVALLDRAVGVVPVAQYHLARLKLLQGDVDTSLQLLQSAGEAMPAVVQRLLEADRDVWQEVVDDRRFQQLTTPATAAPGR
ncbi:MAG: tetratricopeptide repeat protein [Planctomycetota bacterium]|nr:tetratricopeptide repeat protein [Planctomycetota bacterium]